jgi:hypothetical protein
MSSSDLSHMSFLKVSVSWLLLEKFEYVLI